MGHTSLHRATFLGRIAFCNLFLLVGWADGSAPTLAPRAALGLSLGGLAARLTFGRFPQRILALTMFVFEWGLYGAARVRLGASSAMLVTMLIAMGTVTTAASGVVALAFCLVSFVPAEATSFAKAKACVSLRLAKTDRKG